MRRAHCAPLVLNHPCFVYTVKFHPTNQNQLATGSLDGSVRIWCIQESLKSTIKEPVLLQCVTAIGSVAAATFHGKVLALCWINILIDYLGPNGSEKVKILFFKFKKTKKFFFKHREMNYYCFQAVQKVI